MKQVILATMVLVSIVGCGKGPNRIDPALEPYYSEFIKDSDKYEMSIDYDQELVMQFEVLKDAEDGIVLGMCHADGTVGIDPRHWEEYSAEGRKVLIYHELGHCLLGRGHVDSTRSIMYPVLDGSVVEFKAHPSEMIKQLFLSE